MSGIHLICPDCHGAISHECGANLDAMSGANPGAILAQSNGQAQIAHGSEALVLEPSTKKERSYNQGYDLGFLTFWEVYPRHRDKRKALKAWRNAIHRATATQINDGAKRYRDDPNRLEQFTKYAEGWLNGDGWEDDPLPVRLAPGIQPSAPPETRPEDYEAALERMQR